MDARVAVVGGSGRMGSQVVDALQRGGAEAVALSRSSGFDLRNPEVGRLSEALGGCEAVIDCSDSPDRLPASFTRNAEALAGAATAAGVRHLVGLSIVGVDRPSLAKMGYYQAKLAQEQALAAGPLPVTVLRTTQWFSFADQVFPSLSLGAAGRVGVAPRMLMQPVSGTAVADQLASLALGDAAPGVRELGGPEQMSLAALIRRVATARGATARVVQVPMVGVPGFTDGALLPGPDAIIDPTTVEEWAASS